MLDMKVKLDLKGIQKALTKAKTGKAESLKSAGAIVRAAAQRSLTPGNGKPSRPSTPPHSQSGTLKKSILFGLDETTDSVVVGPAKRSKGYYGNIHEHGATVTVGATKRGGRKFKDGGSRKGQKMVFPPRPFMRPALEANLHRLPLSFQNMLSDSTTNTQGE